ncbi:MAG TPA: hypothetical protein EYQ74_03005 [Planctomycetes bacterium]|nr:hypothetical protein [Planctomycetota bacterium]HIK61092.1 hypothetical protein [Planctomycetota bacterium]
MTLPTESIELGLEQFAKLIGKHSQLREELGASGREFFGGDPPRQNAAEALLAGRRHLEWFLFERHSPALFGAPSEHLLEAWLEESPSDLGDKGQVLTQSFVGVFEVVELLPDVGCWLRDKAGYGSYALAHPSADGRMQTGDLLVGRLFPIEDGLHCASSAAAIFRSATLVSALEKDIEQIRANATGKVLRLTQDGLEKMFWGSGHEPQSEDPVGDLQVFLRESAALPQHRIESIISDLTATPYDPENLTPGAGDPLGVILDALAFDTDVNLSAARKHLLLGWQGLAMQSPEGDQGPENNANDDPEPEGPGAAVARFESGRLAGQDLDGLFDDLEEDLGLGSVADANPEDDSPAPDFPGVVGAMISEYRWEIESAEGEAAEGNLDGLSLLAKFAEPIGVFEELGHAELLRFVTFWIHEQEALASAQEARDLLDSLENFTTWVQAAHEHPLQDQFGSTLKGLRESLPRIVELNRALPDGTGLVDDSRAMLFEVCVDAHGQFDHLRDRDGQDHQARLEAGLSARLRAGDRVHGCLEPDGEFTIRRCYPAESAGLVPGSGS